MRSMLLPFQRYADFSGRSTRTEYWMFQLFLVLGYTVLYSLTFAGAYAGVVMESGVLSIIGFSLLVMFWLAVVIPSIAVTVRRLHDIDKSGWFVLLALVPLVNIVVLVFTVLPSTPGPNRFGAPDQSV